MLHPLIVELARRSTADTPAAALSEALGRVRASDHPAAVQAAADWEAWRHATGAVLELARRQRRAIELAAVAGHHVKNTEYNWRHNWHPLNVRTARLWHKNPEAAALFKAGAPFAAPESPDYWKRVGRPADIERLPLTISPPGKGAPALPKTPRAPEPIAPVRTPRSPTGRTPGRGGHPAQPKAPAAPIDAPAAPSGTGANVGDHVDLSGLKGQQRVQAKIALDAIAKVHGDGGLSPLPTKQTSAKRIHGSFDSSPFATSYDKLSLSSKSTHQALTMAHELGHYIDLRGLGRNHSMFVTDMARRNNTDDPVVAAMNDFVMEAASSATIRNGSAAYGAVSPKYAQYFSGPDEMWARAYAQFIATRSGDPTLMQQVRAGQASGYQQWSDADFVPVDAAVENVLRAQGWME